MSRRLLWQLFPAFVIITLLALIAITWYTSRSLSSFYFEQRADDLHARARLIEPQVSTLLAHDNTSQIDSLCKALGRTIGTRITVIRPSGVVIGDSEEDPARMDDHSRRPEIAEALQGRRGVSTRYSATVSKNMMYVAVPLRIDGRLRGVVRMSVPITSVKETIGSVSDRIILGGAAVAILVAIASLWVSRRITRPLEEITAGAEQFARGNLWHRLAPPGSVELNKLAIAMNRMAVQLDERIRNAIRERNEREAILGSMAEGVLAVDTQERVITVNEAAARLFHVTADEARGRSIQEVIRNTELQRLVTETLQQQHSVEGNVALPGAEERYLQVHGTMLHDAVGTGIGALIVLNDITRLRKLENLRRDFVANVSHELKTPVTSILGFVETLQDGAVQNPEDAARFLHKTARQAERLSQIIDDLIRLSEIEKDAEQKGIELAETAIRQVLQTAILSCEVPASNKAIRIDLTCDEDLTWQVNSPLLEQAVINLIDNAIKYSQAGRAVEVTAGRSDGDLEIVVRDQGCGIPPEDQSRVFERFYRVDKGRSRELGGTGLGLAIVKHIALAHGGQVTVESTVGQGSQFGIRIPRHG